MNDVGSPIPDIGPAQGTLFTPYQSQPMPISPRITPLHRSNAASSPKPTTLSAYALATASSANAFVAPASQPTTRVAWPRSRISRMPTNTSMRRWRRGTMTRRIDWSV